MAVPFNIGDCVHLTPQFPPDEGADISKWKKGVDFEVLLITPIHEAGRYQPVSAAFFDISRLIFGAETQVLWLADQQHTFYDKEDMKQVNGFPIICPPTGEFLGIDGKPFEIHKINTNIS